MIEQLLPMAIVFAVLLALIAIRVPLGLALITVSFLGIAYETSLRAAIGSIGRLPYELATNWSFSAVPMFLLMGYIAAETGLTKGLFAASRALLARLPGALACASVLASALFAAASGSSVATAAAMSRIAIPEMLRRRYDEGLACGTVAASGTLGSLIPPSILMILYGVYADVSIGGLFLAGVLPGLLSVVIYIGMIVTRCRITPALAGGGLEKPDAPPDRTAIVWSILPLPLLIGIVMGSISLGIATPTEAGALGAAGAILIAVLTGNFRWSAFRVALKQSALSFAAIFIIVAGGALLTRYVAVAGISGPLRDLFTTSAAGPIMLLIVICALYIILGMFLDRIAAADGAFDPADCRGSGHGSDLVRDYLDQAAGNRPHYPAGRAQHLRYSQRARRTGRTVADPSRGDLVHRHGPPDAGAPDRIPGDHAVAPPIHHVRTDMDIKETFAKPTTDEMHRRLVRLQSAMDAAGHVAYVMADPANVLWLTNFANYVHERPFILIVPATGRPTFLVPRLELDHVEHRVVGDVDCVTYPEFPAPEGKGWRDVFTGLLPAGVGPIAIEPTMPLMIAHAVGSRGQISTRVDELRAVKTDYELSRIAYACRVLSEAHDVLLAMACPGLSQRDINASVGTALLENLVANDPNLNPFATAIHTMVQNAAASHDPHNFSDLDMTLAVGGPNVSVFNAVLNGYGAEIERTFFLGNVPEAARKPFDVMMEARQSVFAMTRPGAVMSDIDRVSNEIFRKHGFDDARRHRAGHGIGVTAHEGPFLAEGEFEEIRVGMVFTIEPGIYCPGLGGFRHSDTVVTTETGLLQLTRGPQDLRALIL